MKRISIVILIIIFVLLLFWELLRADSFDSDVANKLRFIALNSNYDSVKDDFDSLVQGANFTQDRRYVLRFNSRLERCHSDLTIYWHTRTENSDKLILNVKVLENICTNFNLIIYDIARLAKTENIDLINSLSYRSINIILLDEFTFEYDGQRVEGINRVQNGVMTIIISRKKDFMNTLVHELLHSDGVLTENQTRRIANRLTY
jgi:hypothetical protein